VSRAVAAALLGVALVCGFLGLRSEGAASGESSTALATPLWSVRRAPQPVVDAVGVQRLQAALDEELGAGQACVLATDGSGVLAQRDPGTAFIPASTEKLLTAAAVLDVLGPDFRYETEVVAPAAPANGTVDRLWFVGSGDPGLSTDAFLSLVVGDREATGTVTTPLAGLADAIVAAGVRAIPGGIMGDDSRYDTARYLPTWKDTYRTDGQIGPLGALTVDHGFSAFEPRPVPVEDPALFAAQQLTELLRARGVAVGEPGRQTAPADAVRVASVESPPLRDLVSSFLSVSDNLAGELFTRELGVQVAQQGTTAAGTQVILDRLRARGVPLDGVTLVDGSGLDRGNRLTCTALWWTLRLGADPRFAALWDGLSIAGQRGTLADEYGTSPLNGILKGKSGSLDGVTGLVALVDRDRDLRFAFLANGEFSESGGIAFRNRVAEAMGRYPDAPLADALVPGPVTTPSPAPAGS
jgi:D-alanyl-D-alanine carboxypeptidase/D-alanyl-D-alanine-endopeptidase (penicillin-binding protein 4)